MGNYIDQLLEGRSDDYIEGFKQGVTAFAWWKDGVQEVGTTGTRLKDVLAQADKHKEGSNGE